MKRKTILAGSMLLAAISSIFAMVVPGTARSSPPDDLIARSRAMYAALASYEDAGVVIVEYGTSSRDRHTFTTRFNRAPRRFYFDFQKQGGDRTVVWGDPETFHSWTLVTRQTSDYPNPNNLPAINLNDFPTNGSITKIPALLYSKAPIIGAFTNLAEVRADGSEQIEGHLCSRFVGKASDTYGGTQKEVNVRTITLWIDPESLLICQVREVWEAVGGSRNRVTTTYHPRKNPDLNSNLFNFPPTIPY